MMGSVTTAGAGVDEGQSLCDPCKNDGQTNVGITCCMQCDEIYCATCTKLHKNFKLSKDHDLVDVKQTPITTKQMIGFASITKCKNHIEKEVDIDFYCKTHDDMICSICAAKHHKQCDTIEVNNCVTDADEHISESKELLTRQVKQTLERLDDLQAEMAENESDFQKQLGDVRERTKTLRNHVVSLLDNMVTEVDGVIHNIETEYKNAARDDQARVSSMKEELKQKHALMITIIQQANNNYKLVSAHQLGKQLEEMNKKISKEENSLERIQPTLKIHDDLRHLAKYTDAKNLVRVEMAKETWDEILQEQPGNTYVAGVEMVAQPCKEILQEPGHGNNLSRAEMAARPHSKMPEKPAHSKNQLRVKIVAQPCKELFHDPYDDENLTQVKMAAQPCDAPLQHPSDTDNLTQVDMTALPCEAILRGQPRDKTPSRVEMAEQVFDGIQEESFNTQTVPRFNQVQGRLTPKTQRMLWSRSKSIKIRKFGKAEAHRLLLNAKTPPHYTSVVLHRSGQLLITDYSFDGRHLCVYNPDRKLLLKLQMHCRPYSAAHIDDFRVAVTFPDKHMINIVAVGNELQEVKTYKTLNEPRCIVSLNDGLLGVSWNSPPSVSFIRIKGNDITDVMYMDHDASGRKFESFNYMAIDQERQHIIQPCEKRQAVFAFDFKGNPVFKYTHPELTHPCGVAVNLIGHIYVCEYDNNSIHELSDKGRLISVITDGVPTCPRDICCESSSKAFWLVSQSNKSLHDVNMFDLHVDNV